MTKCQFIVFAVRCRQLLGDFSNILFIMALDVVHTFIKLKCHIIVLLDHILHLLAHR